MERPRLVVYCGLPGVGKSTASAYTADQLPATRYRSDEIRKELFDDPTYSAEETERTYEALLSTGREELAAGSPVVLDATFSSREYRDRVATLAESVGADATFVYVTTNDDVVRERMAERTATISDAGFEDYLELKRSFDPLQRDHVRIDNSGALAETYRQIDRKIL